MTMMMMLIVHGTARVEVPFRRAVGTPTQQAAVGRRWWGRERPGAGHSAPGFPGSGPALI